MDLKASHFFDQVPQNKPLRKLEKNKKEVAVFEKKEDLISLEELNDLAEANSKLGKRQNKKILLVDFKTLQKASDNQNYSFQNFLNLGVHRLAGYLKHYDVPVAVARFDGGDSCVAELAEMVSEYDIIGISNLTSQTEEAYQFAVGIKKRFGDEKLIVGGSEHYLGSDGILADQQTTGIDACCVGQGELPLLALALNQPKERVGSLIYRGEAEPDKIVIIENQRFQRLLDSGSVEQKGKLSILNTQPATPFSLEEIKSSPPFAELNGLEGFKFDGTFTTQTSSGCLYGCDFCPSKKFFGAKVQANIGVAKEEILNCKKECVGSKSLFLTFADAMLNSTDEHLLDVIDFMAEVNKEAGPKIYWFAYLSAPRIKAAETLEAWREKWNKILKRMADAGCIMAAVGVEEVIYDRNQVHHKGQDVDTASEFIDLVGQHMLTRALLIVGTPEHFYIQKDKTLKSKKELEIKYQGQDRAVIKGEILDYMKKHPQALYRMNPWTLVYGTDQFEKYQQCLSVDVSDPASLKLLDHLHSLIDPEKMYARLESELGITISPEQRWVKDTGDWFVLMNEIMSEYLASQEYLAYLESLLEKEVNGQKGLLYEIANRFKTNALEQIAKNQGV